MERSHFRTCYPWSRSCYRGCSLMLFESVWRVRTSECAICDRGVATAAILSCRSSRSWQGPRDVQVTLAFVVFGNGDSWESGVGAERSRKSAGSCDCFEAMATTVELGATVDLACAGYEGQLSCPNRQTPMFAIGIFMVKCSNFRTCYLWLRSCYRSYSFVPFQPVLATAKGRLVNVGLRRFWEW